MTPAAGFDHSVLVAALIAGHPEHARARALLEFVATGLTDVGVVCTAPTATASELVRAGADDAWACDRARDVLEMFRLLDVTEEDALQALSAGGPHAGDAALVAASMRRHGVPLVVAAQERLDLLADAGVAQVLSIADADARVDVLIPG